MIESDEVRCPQCNVNKYDYYTWKVGAIILLIIILVVLGFRDIISSDFDRTWNETRKLEVEDSLNSLKSEIYSSYNYSFGFKTWNETRRIAFFNDTGDIYFITMERVCNYSRMLVINI